MAGRKSNLLGSKKDRKSKSNLKQKIGRGLNALAIAEKHCLSKLNIPGHRHGDEEDGGSRGKRKLNHSRRDGHEGIRASTGRRTGDGDSSPSEDGGSDNDGNEWRTGKVHSDDDSEIDSDEAMGSGDEGNFDGSSFSRASTAKDKWKKGHGQMDKIDLSELEQPGGRLSDGLGDGTVDLATAWDMNGDEEPRNQTAESKRLGDNSTNIDGNPTFGDGSDSDGQSGSASALSVSANGDDDDSVDNNISLSRLHKFVNAMEYDRTKFDKSSQKYDETIQNRLPTEYGLTPTRKLTVADLIPTILDPRMRRSLKHLDINASLGRGKPGSVAGKLEVPLPKRQLDRLDRTAAYDKSKETLNRWIETVKANRRAEHLIFPHPGPGSRQEPMMTEMKPQTGLETTIQSILIESGLADSNGKSAEDRIQGLEEMKANKLPIEEVQARRAELRKARELLFREEVRAKRIKKIKSRSYRRVHRKEREKMKLKEREALAAAGVDIDQGSRELYDRLRAEVRMRAKHQDSKWANSVKQTGRAVWDDDARAGMIERARRGEELEKRIEGKRVFNSEDEFLESWASESDGEGDASQTGFGSDADARKLRQKLARLESFGDNLAKDNTVPHSGLFSMKFMRNAEAARKARNDAEIRQLNRELTSEDSQSETEIADIGRQQFGRRNTKGAQMQSIVPLQAEFENPELSENAVPNISETHREIENFVHCKANRTTTHQSTRRGHRYNGEDADKPAVYMDINPWLSQSRKNPRKKNGAANTPADIDLVGDIGENNPHQQPPYQVDPANNAISGTNRQTEDSLSDSGDKSAHEEDVRLPTLLQNERLVKKAFAGDEVLQEFNKEKLDTIEDEGDKVIEDTLPGWGSWAGCGLTKREKKRIKRTFTTVKGVKAEKRRDAKLERVIINEKRIKKNTKYLASQLPHPFESRQQYERSLRLPIGPEWTTKDTFQTATKPRLIVKQGIIKPLQKPLA